MDSGRRLRWADIGKATEAGNYRVDGITISVSWFNIETWQANPSARFVVIETDEMEGRFYNLGSYDI